jgi:glutathione synthase/RimK-type ligase-like ATP-grasp enzyme
VTSRVLLATTCRWPATARLATALTDLGCHVHVVCPPGHPVTEARKISRVYPFRAFTAAQSIRSAIESVKPDLVIPCDDLARECLHGLYADAVPSRERDWDLRALIEHSLGDPSSFATITSRVAMMKLAHDNGIRVPPTVAVNPNALEIVRRWASEHGFPFVLKADGTSGGRGVRFVETMDVIAGAVRALSAPPRAVRALKRALINRDNNYLRQYFRRTRSVLSAQRFVSGRDANVTVACWKGRVLATISVSVLETLDAQGPASVVRLIDNVEMSRAVERIVSLLKLSGLVGFDFMIEDRTGDAYLIEINPRATQMGHLALGPGHDPVAALCGASLGKDVRERPSVTSNDLLALFPQEWLRNPSSAYLTEAYHDIPEDDPGLVDACVNESAATRIWSALLKTPTPGHHRPTARPLSVGKRRAGTSASD